MGIRFTIGAAVLALLAALAALGDSLTVHVGAGEIELCSQARCARFGSHETGYVPGPSSQPV